VKLVLAWALVGCGEPIERDPLAEPAVVPPAATLRRLTQEQYLNSLQDILGDQVLLPTSIEPDTEVDGLYSIGASQTAVSSWGVEKYEDAAYDLAEQVVGEDLRAEFVACEPTDTVDDACASEVLSSLGNQLFRRPVTDAELARVVDLSAAAAETLGDFHEGLAFGVAGLLMAPPFLYRQELGTWSDDEGQYVLSSHELASRLSYFLWNTTPDAALLAAAAADELSTREGLLAQAERLLADDRAREGVRTLFSEMLGLYELDQLTKDTTLFPHMSEAIGPAAREETLLAVDALVFDDDGDYRELLTSTRSFVDHKLASMYAVRAPEREGFGEIVFTEDDGRRGLLGHISFLALNAHAVSSSATLRGKAIREKLLCQTIPLPPTDVDASIPEASEDAPTLRDRVAVHLEDPSCAGCHNLTDPIGLGLENYDSLGMWRLTENDATIDPSGELDGTAFADAWELAAVVAEHDDLTPCMADTTFAYALGHSTVNGEDEAIDHAWRLWELGGYSVQQLLLQVVTSPAFRYVGAVE